MTGVAAVLAAGVLALAPAGIARVAPEKPVATCDYCGMRIEDARFGGRLLTMDRQTLRFDATECMAAFTIRPTLDVLAPFTMTSVVWERPGSWIDARRAYYLLSDRLKSPMAIGLSAYPDARSAAAAAKKHTGRVLRWDQVVALVRERWFLPARR